MTDDFAEDALPGMPPSYRDWLKKQNEKLDRENVPASTAMRKGRIAIETPLKFFFAVAELAAAGGTADHLRGQGRKAVVTADGEKIYKKPQQMTLLDVTSFLIANHDRRIADAASERATVVEWCETHHGYTIEAVYQLAGVPLPGGAA